jgi:hypothetical protein
VQRAVTGEGGRELTAPAAGEAARDLPSGGDEEKRRSLAAAHSGETENGWEKNRGCAACWAVQVWARNALLGRTVYTR